MLRITLTLLFTICLFLPLGHLHVQADNDENKSVFDVIQENTNSNEEQTELKSTTKQDEKASNDEISLLDTKESKRNEIGIGDFFNVIFSLFLVIVLLFVTLNFIKKKNQTYSSTKTILNIGGTSLGGNRSIQLVKVGKQILVLGVAENIQLLKEISAKEEVEELMSTQQNDSNQILQPSNLFSRLFSKINKKEAVRNDDFSTILSNQLTELSTDRRKALEGIKKEKHWDE
jgi:flagellar protein FliO/FliZ